MIDGLEVYAELSLRRITHPGSRSRALYVLLGESLGAVPETRKQLAEFNRQAVAALASLVQAGINRGEFRGGFEPVRVATTFIAALRGLTLQYIIDPGSFDVARIERDVHAIVSTMATGKTISVRP